MRGAVSGWEVGPAAAREPLSVGLTLLDVRVLAAAIAGHVDWGVVKNVIKSLPV